MSAWYLATLSAISFLLSSIAVSLRLLPPTFLFPWGPSVADAWRFCSMSPQPQATCLHPKNRLGVFRGPLVALNALRSLCQLFGCPPGLRPSPPVIFPTITCQGKKSSLVSSCHGHREEEPSLTDGRFDALGSCLLEGLRVRKGDVVGMLSALETNDSQEDLVVCRSEPSEVLRA